VYAQVVIDSRKKWRAEHPDYQKTYRRVHPHERDAPDAASAGLDDPGDTPYIDQSQESFLIDPLKQFVVTSCRRQCCVPSKSPVLVDCDSDAWVALSMAALAYTSSEPVAGDGFESWRSGAAHLTGAIMAKQHSPRLGSLGERLAINRGVWNEIFDVGSRVLQAFVGSPQLPQKILYV